MAIFVHCVTYDEAVDSGIPGYHVFRQTQFFPLICNIAPPPTPKKNMLNPELKAHVGVLVCSDIPIVMGLSTGYFFSFEKTTTTTLTTPPPPTTPTTTIIRRSSSFDVLKSGSTVSLLFFPVLSGSSWWHHERQRWAHPPMENSWRCHHKLQVGRADWQRCEDWPSLGADAGWGWWSVVSGGDKLRVFNDVSTCSQRLKIFQNRVSHLFPNFWDKSRTFSIVHAWDVVDPSHNPVKSGQFFSHYQLVGSINNPTGIF